MTNQPKRALIALLLFGAAVSGLKAQPTPSSPSQETSIPNNSTFQVSTVGVPVGNTIEDKIARAEFYKAQYTHDPVTQAKYQASIDALKQQLPQTNSAPKND